MNEQEDQIGELWIVIRAWRYCDKQVEQRFKNISSWFSPGVREVRGYNVNGDSVQRRGRFSGEERGTLHWIIPEFLQQLPCHSLISQAVRAWPLQLSAVMGHGHDTTEWWPETMEWRTADTGQTHLIRGQNASSTSLSQVSQGFYGKVQFVISKKIYQSCYPMQGLSTGLVIRSLGKGHRSREIPKEDLDCNQITFNMHS